MYVVRLNGGYFKKGYINIAGLDLDPSTPLKKDARKFKSMKQAYFFSYKMNGKVEKA
ncbi:hypothetical protein [Bacillus altitudinis]|uniref:hypothetical protein n=1 Tax=Bacillus altitudinis TaxID=293387 RepID=UPI002FFF20B0